MGGFCFFHCFFFRIDGQNTVTAKNDFLFFSLFSKLKQCTILCERIHFNINPIVCAFTRSYRITKERYVQLLVGFIVWCFGLCKLHLSFWCSLKSVMYVPCAFPFLLIYFKKNRPIRHLSINTYIEIMNKICGHYLFTLFIAKCPGRDTTDAY